MKDLELQKQNYLSQFKKRAYQRNIWKKSDDSMLDEPTEECGIMGMYSYHDIDTFLFLSLVYLHYSTEVRRLVVFRC